MRRPDDWHLHLRDGEHIRDVVGATSDVFGRAIIMPNLNPPVAKTSQALAYKDRIMTANPYKEFTPLMTLYLTDDTTPEDIREAKKNEIVACKLYPQGATTNSQNGVTSVVEIYPVLEEMSKQGLVLCVHGESTRKGDDVFEREELFISRTLAPIAKKFPTLKIVMEHISTKAAVDFVVATDNVAATITPQHLMFNYNDMLVGGIKPHLYCLPILKSELNRGTVKAAAVSGNPKFFLGTDSAPHEKSTKESACGCAGVFSAYHAMPLFSSVFDANDALPRLEAFASINGARWYGLELNQDSIVLERTPQVVPESYRYGDGRIVPLMAGEKLDWTVVEGLRSQVQ